MDEGYIYCLTNNSMPGILKIGFTLRNPNERLKEANSPQTFKPPDSYEIAFAKRVRNPKEKERVIHEILKSKRINPRQEFFRAVPDEVRLLFEIADGEYWDVPKNSYIEKKHIPVKYNDEELRQMKMKLVQKRLNKLNLWNHW